MSKARNYCFTLNNYEGLLDFDIPDIQYAIYQEEVGEEGTPHLQGYVELTKPMRFTQLKSLNNGMLDDAHFGVRKGSQKQAIDYCQKRDETYIDGPYIFGTPAQQGARTDIKEYISSIKKNQTKAYLIENHPIEVAKYPKLISFVREAYELPVAPSHPPQIPLKDIPPTKCLHFTGEHDVGKTTYALAHFNNPLLVKDLDDLRKFDIIKYDGIVFDDVSFSHIPGTIRINILDRKYPTSIRCRYENITIPPTIPRIFTSNDPNIFEDLPNSNYHTSPSVMAAIKSRIIHYHFSKPLFH